jgi:hypothetical protein
VQDTIRECNIILSFAPEHYPSYLILGRFLKLSGDMDGAITNLLPWSPQRRMRTSSFRMFMTI